MKHVLNVSIFSAVLFLGIILLVTKLIDGAAFVAFLVAGCLGASIYALLPSIKEFSIGGNTIKFQEKLNEAERITDELKKLKTISLRSIFKSLKIKQKSNLLVYQNIIEFSEVYQLVCDAKECENDYLTLVMETAIAIRENVFDFVDFEIERHGPHWFDWRDKNIREYIDIHANYEQLPLRNKMSIRFAIQYLYLSDFIGCLSKGYTPALKIVSHDEGWHVIIKGSTWKER